MALCTVWGLGFGVWGLGFGVWGLGFGVWGLGFSSTSYLKGLEGLGCRILGSGFRSPTYNTTISTTHEAILMQYTPRSCNIGFRV